MLIEFDPAKDAFNIEKHGISLAEALRLDWNDLYIEPDLRWDYGEDRYIAYGKLDGRLYAMVFTKRDQGPRIISLRKTNKKEGKRYETKKNYFR